MRIVAFLDQSLYAPSVVDHVAWLARGRSAQVELVQIVSPDELVAAQIAPIHPSVSVPIEAVRATARAEDMARTGARQLDEARDGLRALGVDDVKVWLLEGNIASMMLEAAAGAALVVMGKRGENADLARLPLGSHVESLARGIATPVLAVSRSFRPIERMVAAIDEDDAATVEALAAGIIPAGPIELLHVGEAAPPIEAALESAAARLTAAGFAASRAIVSGEPRFVIPERVVLERFDLLAIGGFGGSRLKSLILGSLTGELLRACQVPILLG